MALPAGAMPAPLLPRRLCLRTSATNQLTVIAKLWQQCEALRAEGDAAEQKRDEL